MLENIYQNYNCEDKEDHYWREWANYYFSSHSYKCDQTILIMENI